MKEKRVCLICAKWFVPRTSLQTTCCPDCRREYVNRYKKAWQAKRWVYLKDYQKQYRIKNKDELNKKAVIRVREWRKNNKRKYQAQTNESRFDGKWLKTMDKYDWQCALCPNEAQLIHHKDRNKENNSDKNLVTLCRACHVKVHHDEIHNLTVDGRAGKD